VERFTDKGCSTCEEKIVGSDGTVWKTVDILPERRTGDRQAISAHGLIFEL